MNYIIYDLEFNQRPSVLKNIDSDNISKLPFEIIQIGALKLNNNLDTISTFNALIKPTLYKTIHPFVEDLTKITTEQVNLCDTFPEVHKNFLNFIGSEEITFCIWGSADIKELIKNIKFHNLSTSSISKKYIDVQNYVSKHFNTPNGTKIGLRNAVELFNISTKTEFHDAFNDAFYTAEVFKKIYNHNIVPKTYESFPSRRLHQPKEKIDTNSLIFQFEKMYNRKMTKDEISIIKTAYMMGKTKQFIKNESE